MRKNKNLISLSLAPTLLLGLTCTMVLADDASRILPGTPQAAQAITALRQAEKVDRMDSESYRGSDDSEAGVAYYRKGQEVKALLDDLRGNKSIGKDDLQRALDTSRAAGLTGD